jgi:hypothetical protein
VSSNVSITKQILTNLDKIWNCKAEKSLTDTSAEINEKSQHFTLSTDSRRSIAQAVGRRPLTAESWCLVRVRPWEIWGQNYTGTGYPSSSSVSPVNNIPPWLSMLVYHLGDKNRPFGGHSSETYSHSIDMNSMKVQTVTAIGFARTARKNKYSGFLVFRVFLHWK